MRVGKSLAELLAQVAAARFRLPGTRMPSEKIDQLGYIQALRACAVLAVVYYHWMGGKPFLEHGYLGVDLFFVISGFIMAASTQTSDGSPRYAGAFLFRRFTRVWPTYAILSCFVAATGIIPQEGMSVADRLLKSVLFVPQWQQQPTIPPGWSLPFEMAFYFIFAASLLFGRWRWLGLAGAMSIGLIVLPLAITGRFSFIVGPPFPVHGAWAYLAMLGSTAMWSFLLGAAAFLMASRDYSISRTTCLVSLAALAAVGFLTVPPGHTALAGLVFAGGTLLLALANNRQTFAVPQILIWIGNISYSLYLVHFPIKFVVIDNLFRFVSTDRELWVLFAVYITASLCLAAASRRWLELSLTSYLQQLHRRADIRSTQTIR